MNWLKNLKTVHKIISLIIVMTIFIIMVGITGYHYNKQANYRLSEVYFDRLLSVQWLNEAKVHNRAIQAGTYSYILTKKPRTKTEIKQKLKTRYKKFEEVISKYEKTNLKEFEKKNLIVLKDTFEQNQNIYKRIIALKEQGQEAKALNEFFSNRMLFEEVSISLQKLIDFNKNYAHKLQKQNEQDFKKAQKILISVVLLALLLSLIYGVFIANTIVKPLENIVEKVQNIASGHLNVAKNGLNAGGEIGILDSAIYLMTQNLKETISKEEFLKNIILASIKSLNKEEVISAIVTETGKFFGAETCVFNEYNQKDKKYVAPESHKIYSRGVNFSPENCFCFTPENLGDLHDIFVNKKEVIFENDVEESIKSSSTYKYSQELQDHLKAKGIKSFLAAPVIYGADVLGILCISYKSKIDVDVKEDIKLFTTIANQFGIVMNQLFLYEKIKESKEREYDIRHFISEIISCDNLDIALQKIIKKLGTSFDVDICEFRFYDHIYKHFLNIHSIYYKEIDKDIYIDSSKEADEYIIKELFDKNHLMFVDNDKEEYNKTFNDFLNKNHIKNGIIVPIFYKNTPLAALSLWSVQAKKDWSENHLDFLDLITPQISSIVSMFYLNEKLKKASAKEKALREMVTNINLLQQHDKVFAYLGENLMKIFLADGYIHAHADSYNKFTPVVTLCNDNMDRDFTLINDSFSKWYKMLGSPKTVIINNIETEVFDESFKSLLRELNIKSFLVALNTKEISLAGTLSSPEKSLNILYMNKAQNWSSDEVSSLNFIIDAVYIIFSEIQKRKVLEETRKNFITTLTHDLRSPLLAEQKALEFILKSKDETHIITFREYLQDIYATNEDLLKMINNLLAVYQYDANKVQLNIIPTGIKEIAIQSIRSLRPLALSRDCEITQDIPDDLPKVNIDEVEIKRVLTNLIGNAIKHTKESTKINISSYIKEKEVVVSVSDNGPGIEEEDKEKIFEKYQTEKREIGSGLGLYLSMQIVKAHHGTIWFETDVGKGTTFFFTLPIS